MSENPVEVQRSVVNPLETAHSIERTDTLPLFINAKTFEGIKRIIPQEYVTATLAGGLSREFNPVVVGTRGASGSEFDLVPTTREADFLDRRDLRKPIDIVDAIGGVTANFFDGYEAIHGPDRLARLKAISRGAQTAKLPGPQREEDREILADIDGLLASIRRFAASGRTEAAEDFAKMSRLLVGKHGKLEYVVQPDGTVKRIIAVPEDRRIQKYERERLADILPKLSLRKSSAYQALARAHRLFGDAAVRVAIKSIPMV